MLRKIEIENFRGIQKGLVEGLTGLNLIVGPNSAGKSTILDAIFAGVTPNPASALQILSLRRPSLHQPAEWLFWRSGATESHEAKITVTADSRSRVVEFFRQPAKVNAPIQIASFDPVTPSPVTSPAQRRQQRDVAIADIPEVRLIDAEATAEKTPLHALYTRVAERGLRRQVKEIITELIPELEDIEILTQGDIPVMYLIFKSGAQPIGSAGDGIRLLLYQALQLASPAGGIVLLEEPEVHLHPAALRQISRAIWAAIERGIQVILTTHSLDLIDSILATSAGAKLETLSLFRVQLFGGVLRTHRLSGTEASMARTQVEDDLR